MHPNHLVCPQMIPEPIVTSTWPTKNSIRPSLAPHLCSCHRWSSSVSNLGYAILGRVVRNITGATAQNLITTQFLQPLGMAETVWNVHEAPTHLTVVIDMRADGITSEPAPADGVIAQWVAGGVWSTVHDMAKWVNFFTDAYPARNDAPPSNTPPSNTCTTDATCDDLNPDDTTRKDEHFLNTLLSRATRREMQTVHSIETPHMTNSPDGSTWPFVGGSAWVYSST